MVNDMIFQGRFTADPELQKTKSDIPYTEFTVAWNDKRQDTETVCFLRCKAWRHTAEFITKYFKKGKEVIVEGRLVTDTWENEGKQQSRTYCLVEKVHFCGSAGSSAAGNNADELNKWVGVGDSDEELPFE